MLNGLKINEIFYSIQGESTWLGLPTIFIRLTGCPLRCNYCDTSYAFYQGKRQTLEIIIETIKQYPCKRVCISGGEPLSQSTVLVLMQSLCDLNYSVSIETSGALAIDKIDKRVMVVMDLKTPESGEVERNLLDNLAYLKAGDQVKIVICSQADFIWATTMINQYTLPVGCEWLLSPMTPGVDPAALAQWLLDSGVNARMQLQLHKVIWDDAKGK